MQRQAFQKASKIISESYADIFFNSSPEASVSKSFSNVDNQTEDPDLNINNKQPKPILGNINLLPGSNQIISENNNFNEISL